MSTTPRLDDCEPIVTVLGQGTAEAGDFQGATDADRLACSGATMRRLNRWPAVHRADAARRFRLALEEAPAGSTLHSVADEGVPIRDIAEVIGRHLDMPLVSIAPGDAGEHFTWLAHFLAVDSPASSALTRELLGWNLTQPGLIDDLDQGHYFHKPST